jgi:hypothetical protein
MRKAIVFAVLAWRWPFQPPRAQAPLSDDLKKAVLAYELTLPARQPVDCGDERADQAPGVAAGFQGPHGEVDEHDDRRASGRDGQKDPKVAEILKANKLTAQEYLVGVPNLADGDDDRRGRARQREGRGVPR